MQVFCHPCGAYPFTEPRWYRVAAREIGTDFALTELASFEIAGLDGAGFAGNARPAETSEPDMVYRGLGRIGDCWREVECWSGPNAYRLVVRGLGEFLIARDGEVIACDDIEPGVGVSLIVESLLGPALVLALALRGTWCLHASAVLVKGRAVAFLGGSGNGKSTLAAFLWTEGRPTCQRIADDVLPVSPQLDGLDMLPHFPQLKLPPENQPSIGMPERIRLNAIYLLASPAKRVGAIEVEALSRREAALALVRHTVAARLFDHKLQAQHLAFCAEVASRVPVRRLAYPRQRRFLTNVRDAVLADLQTV